MSSTAVVTARAALVGDDGSYGMTQWCGFGHDLVGHYTRSAVARNGDARCAAKTGAALRRDVSRRLLQVAHRSANVAEVRAAGGRDVSTRLCVRVVGQHTRASRAGVVRGIGVRVRG